MSTNETPFIKVLRNVYTSGEYIEGVSFSMLLCLIDMETTFDEAWLKSYFALKGREKTEKLEEQIKALSPDYEAIVNNASMKEKDMPNDPSKLAKMQEEKELAQKRRKTTQNVFNNALKALVVFRVFEWLKEKDVRPKVNNKKKLSFTLKLPTDDGKSTYTRDFAVSFIGLADMGEKKAIELGWLEAKPKAKDSKSGQASKGEQIVTEGQITVTPKAGGSTFVTMADSFMTLLRFKLAQFDQLPESEKDKILELEKLLVTNIYADGNGKVDVQTLAEYYTPANGAISKNPEDRKEVA